LFAGLSVQFPSRSNDCPFSRRVCYDQDWQNFINLAAGIYQIAAAHFYQMQYDTAAEEFQAIARDPSSPWHDYGLFLAARCYLRKATVGALIGAPQPAPAGSESVSFDESSMRRALDILQRVASDKSLATVHDSALRLISFAELHLDPEEQALRLSTSLAKPSQDPQFATHLTDYLHLLRDGAEAGDELGEWITGMQQPRPSSIERLKTHPASQPWLVAALLTADGNFSAAPELISAALGAQGRTRASSVRNGTVSSGTIAFSARRIATSPAADRPAALETQDTARQLHNRRFAHTALSHS
jgi:hypothetical protein